MNVYTKYYPNSVELEIFYWISENILLGLLVTLDENSGNHQSQ